MPTSSEIRQQFIDYFVKRRGHTAVPSSPVVPHADPTLLFTNAGMNQFKDVFLGTGSRPYARAVDTQKCIRAGGKHNDLEDVGKDTYHHTFFEMLGNWSFGDYFKKEAIAWAWDLITNVWKIDKSRLYVTVYTGDESQGVERDDEAAELWRTETDIEPSRIRYSPDTFWEMGDTGPCGPNSEIHIDQTPDRSGGDLVDKDDPHVIEFWNLVFIQFNRNADGSLTPLPAKHVDTGMGFERICRILQGVDSNYSTDVFSPLFKTIQDVTGARPYTGSMDDKIDVAYRVIADHIRCLTFALADGAHCGNDGRNYVLRRILRRAVRHGRQTLGVKEPFFYRLVPTVVDTMGDVFPEIAKNPQAIADELKDEEQSFGKTIDRGIELFEQAAAKGGTQVSAEDAFRLHDTYGFPLDLTQVMAEERGMSVDVDGFNKLMAQAREVSRAGESGRGVIDALVTVVQRDNPPATQFTGYESTELTAQTVAHLYVLSDDGRAELSTQPAPAGTNVALVTGTTPFYAESGGQVGDTGRIACGDTVLHVHNTLKVGEVHFHVGVIVQGAVDCCMTGQTELAFNVDAGRRARIMANHTGTHLLNHALRKLVSDQIDQKGSLVDDEKLRFDFSHNAALTDDQLAEIEQVVNLMIAADLPVHTGYAPQEKALQIKGLRAVFGEKYPPTVRVMCIGRPVDDLLANPQRQEWAELSTELCGGTHLAKTGDAQGLVILCEEAVAKGIRRITAQTGRLAHQTQTHGDMLLGRLEAIKTKAGQQLTDALAQLTSAMEVAALPALGASRLRAGIAELQQKLKAEQKQASKAAASQVVDVARELAERADGNLIVSAIDGADAGSLRTAMDVIKKKHPGAAMLLAAVGPDKIAFLAAVPPELIEKGLKAGDWVREVAKVAGGSGGGRPDMAQAGGKDPAKLEEALAKAREFAQFKL